jgi:hypothetical protein
MREDEGESGRRDAIDAGGLAEGRGPDAAEL